MQTTGLIVGKFYPLHQGHLNMILSAKMQVDTLHIFVCSETERDHQLFLESAFTQEPTSQDRVSWVRTLLADIPGIIIHSFNEDGIPTYPNGWEAWSNRLQSFLKAQNILPTLIFSSEPQDKDFYEQYFNIAVQLVDPPRDAFPVSATKIRTFPFQYWPFIPTVIRPFFTRTIFIESTAVTTTLFESLAKLYNAVETSHYPKIRLQAICPDSLTILSRFQQQGVRISGIIASQEMLQKCKAHIDITSHADLRIHTLSPIEESEYNAERHIQQFKESQIFINQILIEK